MSYLSLILLAVVCFSFAPKASAMECNLLTGNSCPSFADKEDEVFCCDALSVKGIVNVDLQRCCNAEEFLKTHAGVIAGIVIGAVVILIIITICCCCFCSCCCLAKRRVQRGHVLYGPVDGAQVITTTTTPTYQIIHPPPTTAPAYSAPPYNPNYAASQPAVNPYYK